MRGRAARASAARPPRTGGGAGAGSCRCSAGCTSSCPGRGAPGPRRITPEARPMRSASVDFPLPEHHLAVDRVDRAAQRLDVQAVVRRERVVEPSGGRRPGRRTGRPDHAGAAVLPRTISCTGTTNPREVRPVAEAGHRVEHSAAGRLLDVLRAVRHAARGDRCDAGLPGDVGEGGGPADASARGPGLTLVGRRHGLSAASRVARRDARGSGTTDQPQRLSIGDPSLQVVHPLVVPIAALLRRFLRRRTAASGRCPGSRSSCSGSAASGSRRCSRSPGSSRSRPARWCSSAPASRCSRAT